MKAAIRQSPGYTEARSPEHRPRAARGWSDLERYVWIISSAIAGVILVSYWQVLLVAAIGIGVMFLTYTWQTDRLQTYLDNYHTWSQGAKGKLAIAVASGGIASSLIFLTISICTAADNLWLGLATALQTIGTIVIAPILLWQFIRKDKQHHQANYHRALGHLTSPDAIERLMGVNQILNQAQAQSLTSQQQREVIEYLELMLNREESPQVRSAILNSLNQLSLDREPTAALTIPVQISQPISLLETTTIEEDLALESWSQD
jgi:hypothetical protein